MDITFAQPPDPDNWASELALLTFHTANEWRPVLAETARVGHLELAAQVAMEGYPPEHACRVVNSAVVLTLTTRPGPVPRGG